MGERLEVSMLLYDVNSEAHNVSRKYSKGGQNCLDMMYDLMLRPIMDLLYMKTRCQSAE
jgi:hypothetical protein